MSLRLPCERHCKPRLRLLTEMGKRGRQRVLERHAIVTEAGKLSELFADVCGLAPEAIDTAQN